MQPPLRLMPCESAQVCTPVRGKCVCFVNSWNRSIEGYVEPRETTLAGGEVPRMFWLHLALLCGLILAIFTVRRGQKGYGWTGLSCFVCAALIIIFWDQLWSLYRFRWFPMNEHILQFLHLGFLILGGIFTVPGFLLTLGRPTGRS